MTLIIGLAGLRRVGKSIIADHLVENHGFYKIHPFAGGKEAVRAYYRHIGISDSNAWEMTEGDLKDTPCEDLPGNATSRLFMESFGKFMGTSMGPEWTIGRELKRAVSLGHERIFIESLVYEDKTVRSHGGSIWMVTRPGMEPVPGLETDAYTATIKADIDIVNDGTVGDLFQKVDHLLSMRLEESFEAVM